MPMRHSVYYRPPRRRLRPPKDDGDKEKEEIKEMVGGNSDSRTYYFRRCKRTGWSVAESIPDELLFEILLQLPAQNIYYEARLVCRKWYHMMRTKNFIHKHLEHASYGLLYRDDFGDVIFISASGGGIDTFKLNYRPRDTIWNSCNGLMLECEYSPVNVIYYVVNVSTDQAFRLPALPTTKLSMDFGAMGYDAASMTYKVVVICDDEIVHILTVGVDKSWRRLRTEHLSSSSRHALRVRPVYTEGFLHWNRFDETKVLTLNLETEMIVETRPPIPKDFLLKEKVFLLKEKPSHCLTSGKYLSFFLRCGKLAWKVFEMKPETGEWRTLPDICLEGQKGRIIERFGFDVDFVPCGWLKYPEVLALRITVSRTRIIIFYNLITCEIGAEELSTLSFNLMVTLHKNSLLCLGGP